MERGKGGGRGWEEGENGGRKEREKGLEGEEGGFFGRGIPPVHFPISHHEPTEWRKLLKTELKPSLSNNNSNGFYI